MMELRGWFRGGRRFGVTALLGLALIASCEDGDPPPIFEVDEVGTIEGLLFFDADENGAFDPASGDEPLAGVTVAVRNRGSDEVLAGATAVTGADGRFVIPNLPAGTHDLFFDETTLPATATVCQNPVPVSIFADEAAAAIVPARAACLISIEEAKAVPLGEFVIVRGIVTSFPGQIDANFAYMEDESGGLFLFAPALVGQGIAVGDQIEVGGTTTIFGGQFELENVVLRSHTEDAATPQPLLVTTAEISASGTDSRHDLQNRFVRVEAAELVDPFGGASGNVQNAIIDDGSGTVLMRVDDGVADRNTLNTLFTVGSCYDINGFAANFNGTGQIFPRSMADVEEVPCT